MEHAYESDEELYTKDSPFAVNNAIEIVAMTENRAVGRLVLGQQHLNGTGIPHGGMYFAFADSVFGAATRYLESGVVTLDSSCKYIAAAHLGDELTCTCQEIAGTRRITHHEARIVNQHGDLIAIAQFTGYRRKH